VGLKNLQFWANSRYILEMVRDGRRLLWNINRTRLNRVSSDDLE